LIQLTNEQVREATPWPTLIAAIEDAVLANATGAPPRASFELVAEGSATGHLLLMPAWQGTSVIGVKTVMFRTDNPRFGLASHSANYILMDGRSGEVLAVLDGEALTARRTAAISIIAAKRLMRTDATRLLVIGAGPVARALASAYASFHAFDTIEIYARDADRAAAAVAELADDGVSATVCRDLPLSAGRADVISMATSARAPVLKGAWLSDGTHVDLVGSFTPEMREVDDALIARAASVWVDTDVALGESGDLVHSLANGTLAPSVLGGSIHDLVTNPPHRSRDAITLFKAVGFALPDLAAAQCTLAMAVQPAQRAVLGQR